jgi:diacylglycerol kinase
MQERSFAIQVIIGIVALGLAVVLNISRIERIIIVLLVAVVLGMEAFNTAIEIFLDRLAPYPDPDIARVKEVLAASVLIVSVGALAVGFLIFGPAIFR